MGGIDFNQFEEDPYRAGAAHILGKDAKSVTAEERFRFKDAVLAAAYGRRFHIGAIETEFQSFEHMFARQRNFTFKYLISRGMDLNSLTEEERVTLTKEYLLSLHAELTEVLENTNWKTHRDQPEKRNYGNVKIELIDVQKFLWGLCAIWWIDEVEFCKLYKEKSDLVEERFQQEQNKK